MSTDKKIRVKIIEELSNKFKNLKHVPFSEFNEEYGKMCTAEYAYQGLLHYSLWDYNSRQFTILEFITREKSIIKERRQEAKHKLNCLEHALKLLHSIIDKKEQELVDNLVITI